VYICVGVSLLPLSTILHTGYWKCSDSVVFLLFILLSQGKFEDTKTVIRICKSKRNSQHNG